MTAGAEVKDAGGVLEITRVFDAPRALVWSAWTEKEHALQWSGPRDHPVVQAEHDVRPGGEWRSCLMGADKRPLWQGGVYKEVVPLEKLVFTTQWDADTDGEMAMMLVTILFADANGGKTEMRFRQENFTSVAERNGHRGGWNSSFDRLNEFLAKA